MLDALREPVVIGGVTVEADASIGIALTPEHGGDLGALLRCADVAMYQAKRLGSDIAVYDPETDPREAQQLTLLGRAAPGHPQRGTAAVLPAEITHRRAGHRGGSAHPMEPPPARPATTRHLHAAGRADLSDQATDSLGAARGRPPMRHLARPGRGPARGRQRVPAQSSRRRPARHRARRRHRGRHRRQPSADRDHRDRRHGEPTASESHRRAAAQHGSMRRDR